MQLQGFEERVDRFPHMSSALMGKSRCREVVAIREAD